MLLLGQRQNESIKKASHMDLSKIKREKADKAKVVTSIYISRNAQKKLEVAAAAANVSRGGIVEALIKKHLK